MGKHSKVSRDARVSVLLETYGKLLTDVQHESVDYYYNQDLSLAEIAEELNVSRQGVHDNLSRAEALLRNMEEKTGCVRRDLSYRRALSLIRQSAEALLAHDDICVSKCGKSILAAVDSLEE